MSLPFLPNQKKSSVVESLEDRDLHLSKDAEHVDPYLMQAAESVLSAIENKSAHDLALALKFAHDMCSTMPSEEE